MTGSGDTLTRFGELAETADQLAEQARQAEVALGVHGVSARFNSTRRGRKAALSDVLAAFPDTRQTGANPKHYTVVLPKPVTEQVADRFNQLFQSDS